MQSSLNDKTLVINNFNIYTEKVYMFFLYTEIQVMPVSES